MTRRETRNRRSGTMSQNRMIRLTRLLGVEKTPKILEKRNTIASNLDAIRSLRKRQF